MIKPKVRRLTPAEERAAYKLATLRDGGMCVRCLTVGQVNRDHRKNRSVGGLTTAGNLQLLCGSGTTGCHGWKTEHPTTANLEGFGVPGWADPLAWPAWKAGSWVLYDDQGGWETITAEQAWRLKDLDVPIY